MSEYDGSKPLKNARQEKFCHCFIVHYNGARAAREAGFAEKGAGVEASRLLNNPNVLARKNYLDRMAVEALGVTKERIQKELTAIAFARANGAASWSTQTIEHEGEAGVRNVQYPGVYPKNSDELPDEVLASIKKVKQGKDGLEIEYHDKTGALKMLAAQVGMVTDNTKTATEVSIQSAPTVNVVVEKA